MEIDLPVGQVQNSPRASRSGQSNEQTPQVDHLIFDTNMYLEGRPCVHVRRAETSSSTCTYGDWVEARVLLCRDKDRALHVTIVKAVSKRCTSLPSASTRQTHQVHLVAACRRSHRTSSVWPLTAL